MDYEDGASGYNTSEVDWGEEENHSWSGGGEDQEHEPWGDQTDSEIRSGDELDGEEFEPEPPHYVRDNTSPESWYGEEEIDQEGEAREVYEEDSWPEETDSQFSLGDGGHETEPEHGESYHGEEPWSQEVELEASYNGVSKLDQEEPELEYTYDQELEEEEPEHINANKQSWEHSTDDEGDFESHHICFSGHSQGPEAYIRWEKDMEDWLQANNIPEEVKTSYAEDTLTEDAFRCWEQDAYVRLEYDEPDSSWEEMKQMLHKEFVEDAVINQQYYSRIYAYPEPRRWIIATRPNLKAKPKKALCPETKNVSPSTLMEKTEVNKPVRAEGVQPVPNHETVKKKQSSKQLFKPQNKPKLCKSSKLSKEVITTCYRCHKRGHYAVVCPTRPVDNSNAQEVKLDSSSDCLVQSNSEISISSMMHLSLPKSFDPGIRQEEVNTSRDTIMFQIVNAINVSLSFTRDIPIVLNSDIIHLFLAQSVENFAGNTKKKIGHEEGRSNNIEEQCEEAIIPQACQATNLKSEVMPRPIPGTLVSETYDLIQYGNNILTRHGFKYSAYNDSTSSIKHLIFFLSVEKKTGTLRVCHDWRAHRDEQGGTTNNALLQEEPPDLMLNSYAMTSTRTEHNKGSDQVIPFLNLISNESNYVIMNLLCPEEFEENSVLVETTTTHFACLKPHVIEDIDESCYPVYKNPMTVITHLSLVKGEEDIAGTEKKQQENETPRINGDNKCEKGVFTKKIKFLPKEVNRNPWRGVIATLLIKEEPPDAHIPSHMNRQNNFGQGEIVSRSKPFQEGEYDEDIKSSSAKEHGTRSLEEENKKLRRAMETCELSSAQEEAKINYPSSTNTWRTFSAHTEHASKWNQPKPIPDEGVIEDTIWKIFNGPDGDMRPLIESFRPKQDEPSCKSNCFGFSTHHTKTENWFRDQILFGSRVIDFTNRVNRSFPDLDQPSLIGGLQPNQRELSYKPTWFGILTQPGITSNWIHSNTDFGLGDIYFLSGRILNLPYLEAHEFRNLQTHIWRPGEYLLQPEASSITSRHLEESSTSFSCTSIHRIRRIPSCSYFPYTTPRAFTLGVITLQRLFPICCGVLETFSMHLDVPRHHSFAPKLSRLKPHHKFPYLAKIHSLSVQRLVCLVKTRFLSSS